MSTQAMVDAAVQAGHPLNRDHNGADILGVGFNHLTIKDGKRVSTAVASCVRRWSGNLSLITTRAAAVVRRQALRRRGRAGQWVLSGGRAARIPLSSGAIERAR